MRVFGKSSLERMKWSVRRRCSRCGSPMGAHFGPGDCPRTNWVSRTWTIGALIVPTVEWIGVDVDDETKARWVEQFEKPTRPTVGPVDEREGGW